MNYNKKRVLVLGGGFGGAYCAQALGKRLNRSQWDVTLVDRNNYLLFYPLLVEAGVGALEPRHVVVPIRRFLKRGEFRMAEVLGARHAEREVDVRGVGRDDVETIRYDHLVLAFGSVTKFPPVPGLDRYGFELKTLADAVELRDRGIGLLECANGIADHESRRGILRMVVVGSNFSGIELAGEYHDFMVDAARSYPNIDKDDVSVVVLEIGKRIIPAIDDELAEYARAKLAERGVDIRTETSISEIRAADVALTTGETLTTQTVVWCAGIAPNPVLSKIDGLPLSDRGYVRCGRDLRVEGFDNVWAVGDIAYALDSNGKPYEATAQNATRQGSTVAKNVVAAIEGRPTNPFEFDPLGSIAAIGCKTAVAKVFGVKLHGFAAWFLYRSVYLLKMPSFSRRFRIVVDWTAELLFKSDIVQLGVRKLDPESRRLLAKAPADRSDPASSTPKTTAN